MTRSATVLVPAVLGLLAFTSACSYTGDALKAPSGSSAMTVTASSQTSTAAQPSASAPSPTIDSKKPDPIVTPAGNPAPGAFTFCDVKDVKAKQCSAPTRLYEGGRLACSTKVKPGAKVTMRLTRDGAELVKETGTLSKPGADGKVAISADLGVDPAKLPAGIYGCEFSVDGGKSSVGSVKVRGPKDHSGVGQVSMCPEVRDLKGSSTYACASTAHVQTVERKKPFQCSAVIVASKNQPLRVRIRKDGRDFDFPFPAEKVNKNLGVVSASVTLGSGGPIRCEVYKNEKLVAARDFRVGVTL